MEKVSSPLIKNGDTDNHHPHLGKIGQPYPPSLSHLKLDRPLLKEHRNNSNKKIHSYRANNHKSLHPGQQQPQNLFLDAPFNPCETS